MSGGEKCQSFVPMIKHFEKCHAVAPFNRNQKAVHFKETVYTFLSADTWMGSIKKSNSRDNGVDIS